MIPNHTSALNSTQYCMTKWGHPEDFSFTSANPNGVCQIRKATPSPWRIQNDGQHGGYWSLISPYACLQTDKTDHSNFPFTKIWHHGELIRLLLAKFQRWQQVTAQLYNHVLGETQPLTHRLCCTPRLPRYEGLQK